LFEILGSIYREEEEVKPFSQQLEAKIQRVLLLP
jgi:ABC-type enterochelin transport system substrate-binding protein